MIADRLFLHRRVVLDGKLAKSCQAISTRRTNPITTKGIPIAKPEAVIPIPLRKQLIAIKPVSVIANVGLTFGKRII
jgi:hypothetical protein